MEDILDDEQFDTMMKTVDPEIVDKEMKAIISKYMSRLQEKLRNKEFATVEEMQAGYKENSMRLNIELSKVISKHWDRVASIEKELIAMNQLIHLDDEIKQQKSTEST